MCLEYEYTKYNHTKQIYFVKIELRPSPSPSRENLVSHINEFLSTHAKQFSGSSSVPSGFLPSSWCETDLFPEGEPQNFLDKKKPPLSEWSLVFGGYWTIEQYSGFR